MAVQRGTKNGSAWASAPSRRFGRAWIPLAQVLEDDPDAVEWISAHCSKQSVGVKRMSNGVFMTETDLAANANVDSLAKRGAREYTPTLRERNSILTASALVSDIARWLGVCTVLANRFPFEEDGKRVYKRDSDAKKKRSIGSVVTPIGQCKRKIAFMSPDSLGSVLQKPASSSQAAVVPATPRATSRSDLLRTTVHRSIPVGKRRKLTQKIVDDRENATFHAHWLISRDHRPPLAPPPLSAADRFAAIRGRMTANNGNRGGSELVP